MSGSPADGLVAGARLEVTRGRATPEEALAVLLALDQATAADRASDSTAAAARPGWREAARREQARGVVYAAAPDLTRARWP